MEEQNKDRVNVKRTLQLLDTKPETIATACPFCMTMLTDGLKDQEKEEDIRQLDIAEILADSCLGKEKKASAEDVAARSRRRSLARSVPLPISRTTPYRPVGDSTHGFAAPVDACLTP